MRIEEHEVTRSERREQRRRSERRMGVSGRSVKLLLTIEQRRAAEAGAYQKRPSSPGARSAA
ncbi:MAG: hypothetical protein NTZ05_18840 [Chloroflexi bacterium]|nr:hypothetical protein [Chloroflexota bacterium]